MTPPIRIPRMTAKRELLIKDIRRLASENGVEVGQFYLRSAPLSELKLWRIKLELMKEEK